MSEWKPYDPNDGSQLMTLDDYRDSIEVGSIKFGDGKGYAVADDNIFSEEMVGTRHDHVPIIATHVAWYRNETVET